MEETLTPIQIGKKYGIIYGLIGVLVTVIPMVMEIQIPGGFIVPSIIAAIIYVVADKEFRAQNGGFMSFGEGFKLNITAAVIAGSIRSVVSYAYLKLVDPTYTERMQQIGLDNMRERGMTEAQIEQGQSIAKILSNPETGLIIGIVWAVLGALIIGSIVAAVIKNESEESF
jgi:uncharacterized protein DUF4199